MIPDGRTEVVGTGFVKIGRGVDVGAVVVATGVPGGRA
jgi:hypothetical protein